MNGSESLKNQAISKAKGAISSGGAHKNGKGQMKKRKQEVSHHPDAATARATAGGTDNRAIGSPTDHYNRGTGHGKQRSVCTISASTHKHMRDLEAHTPPLDTHLRNNLLITTHAAATTANWQ